MTDNNDNPEVGIRSARLTRLTTQKSPIGYVAYCNYCSWSTGICVGMGDNESLSMAQSRLNTHRKNPTHHATLTSANGA